MTLAAKNEDLLKGRAYTDGSILITLIDAEQGETIWQGTSLVRIDSRERGPHLNRFIVGDVNYKFQCSPFRYRQQFKLLTAAERVSEGGH